MSQDILIIVNCDRTAPNRIQMFCDPSIAYAGTQGGGEGSNELGVKVPLNTELRWRAVPLQTQDPNDAGVYHVVIKRYHLWNNAQGNAANYLVEWGTSNGGSDAPFYKPPGNLAPDTDAAISTEGIDRPFVQCLTQLTSRDENLSPQIAYSFTVTIFKNGDKVEDLSWDPYVVIYRP
ncbi:hypothetical protein [Nannocystis sp. SCPEA4]|uniref:hypothetical protein n=1 Tax=Nannocystis sp. SCPEA4 TaxID=2996787 RepID=UPI00226F66E3|nr:hypothetical protein [Nannocystis sp. SCPEA4]MCY1055748.1 hypothetical protein [Nannocystis sp. SCPEA4]